MKTARAVARPVGDMASLVRFVTAHGERGLGAPAEVLLGLARGPDSVFDVHDGDGRALVGALTDACENTGDAAELFIVAARDGVADREALGACLAAAIEAVRRGPRSVLETMVGRLVRPHLDLLVSLGFAERYAMTSLEGRGTFVPVEAEHAFAWSDVSAEDLAALGVLSRAAFVGHPGVNFAPDNGRDRLLGRTPPVRLLRTGMRIAGSVSVRREPDGSGYIEIVQRHPDFAGRGLGPVLMTEALRLLDGVRPVRLDASIVNRRALALYERFGFTVTDVCPVQALAV